MDALARLDRKFTALFGPGLDVLADERNLDKTRAYAASFAQSYAKLGAEYAASGLSAASATANGKAYELLVAYAESRVRHNPPQVVDTQAQQLMTEVLLAARRAARAERHADAPRRRGAARGYVGDGVGDRLARLSLRQGSPASPGGRPSFAPATPTSPGLAPPRVAATPSSSSRGGGPRRAAATRRGRRRTRRPLSRRRRAAARLAAARLRRDGLGARSGRAAAGSSRRRPSRRAVAEDLGLSRPTPPRAAAGARPPRAAFRSRGRGGGGGGGGGGGERAAAPLVQQAAQLRRDADGLAALRRRASARRRRPPPPVPTTADAAGERLRALGARAPKDGERAGAVPRARCRARAGHAAVGAAGELAEVALRLRLFVEVVPIAVGTLRASLAAGSRAAVERAEAHLSQLALPAPAAADDGAALRAEAAKLPPAAASSSACAPPRAPPAALALTLAPSAEPPFGADGGVIGRLLDGHDLLTQLCANRAAASGPPIEVNLDD